MELSKTLDITTFASKTCAPPRDDEIASDAAAPGVADKTTQLFEVQRRSGTHGPRNGLLVQWANKLVESGHT